MGVASSALVALVVLYADPILLTGPIVPRIRTSGPRRCGISLARGPRSAPGIHWVSMRRAPPGRPAPTER